MTHTEQYHNAIIQYSVMLESSESSEVNIFARYGNAYRAQERRMPPGADLYIEYIDGGHRYMHNIIVTLCPMPRARVWRFIFNDSVQTIQRPASWLHFRTEVFNSIEIANQGVIPAVLLNDPPDNYDEGNEYSEEHSDDDF